MTPGVGPLAVLMVCTGNLCRSPMAEFFARRTLAEYSLQVHPSAGRLPVGKADLQPGAVMRSAGTHGWDGSPMHPDAATVLAERGVDPTGFRARSLTPAMVESADLVLCATRAHRAKVVTMLPRAVRRCFTMAEFARLTADVVPTDLLPPVLDPDRRSGHRAEVGTEVWTFHDGGARLVEAAARCRASGLAVAATAADDDVPDPLGRGLDAFRLCADQVSAAVCRPFELLGWAARTSGSDGGRGSSGNPSRATGSVT